MMRKVLSVLFCLGVLLGSVSAMASEQMGTIGVMLDQEGAVTLYRVGEICGESFHLFPGYGGETVNFDQIISPELASILAQEAAEGSTQRAVDGLVTFTGLEQGIYLLVQTEVEEGSYPFSPFLVTIPWDGDQWTVHSKPKTAQDLLPKTGQDLRLLLGAGMMLASALGLMGCCYAERGKKGRT